jgi:DNA topoisomerase-1
MKSTAALAEPSSSDDAIAAAAAAGLRYVSDARPGLRRRRHGRGFSYVTPEGRVVRDAEALERIRALAIPPAWTEVWICPSPSGHIQATGRDARGRKQYRYHARWREVRDATKFARMVDFGEALPSLRRRVRRDMALPGLPREKVVATVVRLLESTCIRVGNDEYQQQNGTFGLTTLHNRHVDVQGERIFFRFRAKGGKLQQVRLSDRSVAKAVRLCQDLPGYELFQYRDADGQPRPVDSADVNDYLRAATGQPFTAKDFRTWAGTLRALSRFRQACREAAEPTKASLLAVLDQVAHELNNTRAVCRKFYVHPGLQEDYSTGRLRARLARLEATRSRSGLSRDETILLRLLRLL